ncbi:MAG: hypothetical protein IPK16_24895 [Anaerolineales bacterium]|nr:hypothetical protein [Anaerolineales bacterium]
MSAIVDSVSKYPIIRSKLQRPRIGGQLVIRPRLLEQLNAATSLVFVIAPAGYGKTTLLSTWLETNALPSAWLSLDEHDNDLVMFLTYLVDAVRTLFPTACHDTLVLLQGMTMPPIAVISRTLLTELATIQQEFVLVLDDFHLIHERVIQEVMIELTRRPPQALHLVFAARTDPPLPMASLRVRGDVVELREADLRFSLAETTAFLREQMHLQIDDQSASDLNDQTEGWIAGLCLTALYIRHAGGPKKLTTNPQGYSRYVISYLVAEVLAHVPSAIQEFLIKTSILERFCGPLCEAVTNLAELEQDGQTYLEWLEHNNLFLLSIDEDRRWYRYHHLFQRLLLDQLERKYGSVEVNALHTKASAWFAQNGYPEDALRHALAGNDTAAAVQVFAQQRQELTNGEQWHHLERLLRLFPRAVIDREPELLLSEVWFLINREQLADVPRSLDQVEALLRQQPPDAATADRLQGEVECRRSTQYYFASDHARCIAAARRALEKLPAEWWMLRAQARLFLSVASLAVGELRPAYAVLYDSGEPDHGRAFQTRLLVGTCFVHWQTADLTGLAQAATRILDGGDQSGLQLETNTWAHYHLGSVHYLRNELAAAERQLAPLVRQPYLAHVQCFLTALPRWPWSIRRKANRKRPVRPPN